MASTAGARPRGLIRQRGKSHQVIVYGGHDPVTGKEIRLSGTARTVREAEKLKTQLLAKVDKQRNAATRATLSYALDAWLDTHDGEQSTVIEYRGYAERTIKPALGDVPISKLTALTLERLYAQLRRCGARCDGKSYIEHATDEPHECGAVIEHRRVRKHDCEKARCRRLNCRPHVCRPFAQATILKVHFILSGTFAAAVRWGWIDSNPADSAKKPKQRHPQPKPPTTKEVAAVVNAALAADEQWGIMIWLVMVTGIRRGELCGLQWRDVDFDASVLWADSSYWQRRGSGGRKGTKTHQHRRIALDDETLTLLRAQRERYKETAAELELEPRRDAYVFSYDPAHLRAMNPDGISHKYRTTCERVGVDSHIQALRQYSATELISEGVDLRTVAGRLGHGGGGSTTLRVYAA